MMRFRGFTILEFMVAAAIFLLVVIPLARLYVSSLDVVKNSENYTIALHLAETRMQEVESFYSSNVPFGYDGGIPLDFDGCAGNPYHLTYTTGVGWRPDDPYVQRIRTPGATATPIPPAAGEPRSGGSWTTICPEYLTAPPAFTPIRVPPSDGDYYFYNDAVYIMLNPDRIPGNVNDDTAELSAISAINEGLDQVQIIQAIIAARLDPVDAFAIYYGRPDLDPVARIDGIEDYNEILDLSLLTRLSTDTNVPNPGYNACTDEKYFDVPWHRFGYARIVCGTDITPPPSKPPPVREWVFDPRIIMDSQRDAVVAEIRNATKTYANFKRITEITGVFYMGDDRNGDGIFDRNDYPNWWHFYFQASDPYSMSQRVYGRMIRVSVFWRTGKKQPDPYNSFRQTSGLPRRVVDLEKKVQIVKFIADPDNNPCDDTSIFLGIPSLSSASLRVTDAYAASRLTPGPVFNDGFLSFTRTTSPTTPDYPYDHADERFVTEYSPPMSLEPARLGVNSTSPEHFLDPQCVIQR